MKTFEENQTGLLHQHEKTQRTVTVKPGSITGNYFYHHHVEPRVKLNVPREETHPTPLKYIDATRDTNTTLDVDHDTSDAWTGFKLPSWTKGFHTGITGLSGG